VTADPREVIRAAVSEHWLRIQDHRTDPGTLADAVLTALAIEGLDVVPIGERREEWAVEDPQRTTAGLPLHIFGPDEAEARSLAGYHESLVLYRRTVYATAWEPVDGG
jgi:hypothetical protein